MSTQVEPVAAAVGDAVEMTYREAVNAALEDEMAADPTVYLLGEDVANDGRRLQDERRPARAVPRPRHEHADLREHVHRRGDRDVGHGPAARSSRSCSATSCRRPATRSSRSCPKFRFMTGGQCYAARHGALDRRRRPAASGRSTRRPASRGSWRSRACSWRPPGRRPAPTACCARRSATTIPCCSSSTRACTGARGRSRAATRGIAEIGKARDRARGQRRHDRRDAADGSTARSRPPSSSRRRGSTPRSSTCAGCARSTCRSCARASRRPGGCVVVEEQVHAGGWGATLISRLTIDGVRAGGAAAGRRAAGRHADPVQPAARGRDHPRRCRDRCGRSRAPGVGRIRGSRAPSPLVPRRSRLEHEDAREGRDAGGRRGAHRPRGRSDAAREERRDPAAGRRRAARARVARGNASRARERCEHPLVLPRHRLRGRARCRRARLHHPPEGRDRGRRPLRRPAALAARAGARRLASHRPRGADRESARAREHRVDRRRLRSRRDADLRVRATSPRAPACPSSRSARPYPSTAATSGTTCSRASSRRRALSGCRRSTGRTRRSAIPRDSGSSRDARSSSGSTASGRSTRIRSSSATRSSRRRIADYERAERILDAYAKATGEDGRGAVVFEGEMIDEASRKMAEQVAARGRAAGLGR